MDVRSGRLEIILKEELAWRPQDVSQLALFGQVQVSTQALGECFARDIPVLWLSSGGWLQEFALGQPVGASTSSCDGSSSRHTLKAARGFAYQPGRGHARRWVDPTWVCPPLWVGSAVACVGPG